MHCKDFRTTMEVIAIQAFRMFLGIPAEVRNWDTDGKSCSIVFTENPLADFVVLPTKLKNELWFSNLLAGIIKGALEVINLRVRTFFLHDQLRGDNFQEIRVELLEVMTEKDDANDL